MFRHTRNSASVKCRNFFEANGAVAVNNWCSNRSKNWKICKKIRSTENAKIP